MSAHPKPPFTQDSPALSAEERLKRVEETLRQVVAGDATLTPEQVMAKLRELAPGVTASPHLPTVVSERMIRGYQVRTLAPQLTEEERKARQAVTLQAMAQALKELPR